MLARLILCLIGSLGLAATVAAQPVVDPNIPRPGYLLVMGTPTDPAAMGRYARTLPPIYAKLGGYYLALGGIGRGITVLEGSFKSQSVVLAKFPRLEGPNEFWWSPEYRSSVEIRRGAGSFNVVKLKGMPGDLDVTLLRFPSMQALETFYRDPAYQRAIPLRHSAGDYTLLAIDGVAQP